MAWKLKTFRRYNCRRLLVNACVALYILLVFYALTNSKDRCRVTMPDENGGLIFLGIKVPTSKTCRVNLKKLNVVKLNVFEHPNMTEIQSENSVVKPGGSWAPSDCEAWQKVAIIIPYRDRWHHLLLLLKRLHPMLRRQKVDYHFYVIEQAGNDKFNRGRLMNIGFKEALKQHKFDCFIFHDVDLLPENDKNIYYCDQHLRHLSSAIDEMRYHVMYYNYAGGVISVNRQNVFRLNGYSNNYWGWGGEDDDFSARSIEAGLLLTRPPEHIGRYKMVRHIKAWRGDNSGYGIFMTWRNGWLTDGINTLGTSHYRVTNVKAFPLFTRIIVDIGKSPQNPPNLDGVQKESLWWFLNYFIP